MNKTVKEKLDHLTALANRQFAKVKGCKIVTEYDEQNNYMAILTLERERKQLRIEIYARAFHVITNEPIDTGNGKSVFYSTGVYLSQPHVEIQVGPDPMTLILCFMGWLKI